MVSKICAHFELQTSDSVNHFYVGFNLTYIEILIFVFLGNRHYGITDTS